MIRSILTIILATVLAGMTSPVRAADLFDRPPPKVIVGDVCPFGYTPYHWESRARRIAVTPGYAPPIYFDGKEWQELPECGKCGSWLYDDYKMPMSDPARQIPRRRPYMVPIEVVTFCIKKEVLASWCYENNTNVRTKPLQGFRGV